MSLIVVRDMDQTRVMFYAAVKRIGKRGALTAFNRALNSEGAKLRTIIRRNLRRQTGAKASVISAKTKSIRSTFANLEYKIEATGRHMTLSHFGPAQFRYGVRARPWGRSQKFPGTFIVSSLSGNVFKRDGSSRLPISVLYGPSIPKEMLQDETRAAFEQQQPAILREAQRQIERLMPR